MKNLPVLLVLILTLGACSSLKTYYVEPRDANPTLLVGAFERKGSLPSFMTSAGSIRTTFYLVNQADKQSSEIVLSGKSFYSRTLPEGDYLIRKVVFASESESIRGTMTLTLNLKLHVTAGVVNNLGTTYIIFDENDGFDTQTQNDREEFQKAFRKQYKNSGWNEIEWVDTVMTR